MVRVSDMIAYLGKDRADALHMGVLKSYDCFDAKLIGTSNSVIINNLTVDIVNNSYGKDVICMSEQAFLDVKLAKQQNNEFIYSKEGMVGNTGNIVEEMFCEMYDKLLADLLAGNELSPVFKHHIKKLVAQSLSFTQEEYLREDPHQIIVDYLASMTDGYFVDLYRFLFPEKQKKLLRMGYCSDLR